MIRLLLVIFAVLVSFGIYSTNNKAQAGFEFLPSKQNYSAPVSKTPELPSPQRLIPPPQIVPPMMPAAAASPVIRQPLNTIPTPPPSSGLVIDPYPLRQGKTAKMLPSDRAVAISMAETGGAITPVQLGAGMTTGVKPHQMQGGNTVNIIPASQGNQIVNRTSLTPIPGGEPAPLSGVEQAYYDQTITQTRPVIYANAVGFARDIPLVIALEQIIPAGFTPRFVGDAVQENIFVSWEGGQPWNVVLNNMLRPYNLTAVIQGQTVTIQSMAQL